MYLGALYFGEYYYFVSASSNPSPAGSDDALAGRYGPVNYRFRFERRTKQNAFQENVSTAFDVAKLKIDGNNDRDIFATAGFGILPAQAPTIDPNTDNIAVFEEVLVNGSWVRFQVGLFALNIPSKTLSSNGVQVWDVAANDMAVYLQKAKIQAPFTLPISTNYLLAAKNIIIQQGLAISALWPTASSVTPIAFTWPAATPWLKIVNDLLFAINYYPVWADSTGQFVTRQRIDPSTETVPITYSNKRPPLMLQWPLKELEDRTRSKNQMTIPIADPLRTPASALMQNNDPASHVSIQSLSTIIADSINGDRVVDTTTAQAIAKFELQQQASMSLTATLLTLPDPRRWAREYYSLTVDDYEIATLWRVASWSFSKAQMSHIINRAYSVIITAPFSVAPAALAQSAGVAFNVVVTAQNADGSTLTSYGGTVTFTCTDPSATLPSPYAYAPGSGTHTFSVTLATPGNQVITVTDSSSTAQGASQPVLVT